MLARIYGWMLGIHWGIVLTMIILAILIAMVISIQPENAGIVQVAANWDSGKDVWPRPPHH